MAANLGEVVRGKYPRIIRRMRAVCLLTEGEAVAALVQWKYFGEDMFGSEAVIHLGGPKRAISYALSGRHTLLH